MILWQIMKALDHPNLVKLFDIYVLDENQLLNSAYSELCIAMEFLAGGSLMDALFESALKESQIAAICKEVNAILVL